MNATTFQVVHAMQGMARHYRAHITDVQREESSLDLERLFFDMKFSDGRIYRVRVSDITPERERETA